MKTISVFILAILIILVTCYCGFAQSATTQVINSTGGSGKKAVFFFDWSVGELSLINTLKNADSSFYLTSGLLQPAAVAGKPVVNYSLSRDEVNMYPIPTADKLFVTVSPKQKGQIRIYLYDQKAGLVFSKIYPSTSIVFEAIPMNSLVNGLYTLRVELYPENSDPRISSYPIMKINK